MQGLESAEADVEGYFGANGAGGFAAFHCFIGEVQAGGGGGDAAAFAGEDGLVALGVGYIIGTADVGRERDVAVGFDGLPFITMYWGMQADAAFAMLEALFNDGVEAGREFDDGAGGEFAAGTNEGAPGIAQLFGEEDFDAAGVAGAVADEAGLEDAGASWPRSGSGPVHAAWCARNRAQRPGRY